MSLENLLLKEEYHTKRLEMYKIGIHLANLYHIEFQSEKSAKFGKDCYNPLRITGSLIFNRELNTQDVDLLSNFLKLDEKFKEFLLKFVDKFVHDLIGGYDLYKNSTKLYIFTKEQINCINKYEDKYKEYTYYKRKVNINDCIKFLGNSIMQKYLKHFTFDPCFCFVKDYTIFIDYMQQNKPLKNFKQKISNFLYSVCSKKEEIDDWLTENENHLLTWIGLSRDNKVTIYVNNFTHVQPIIPTMVGLPLLDDVTVRRGGSDCVDRSMGGEGLFATCALTRGTWLMCEMSPMRWGDHGDETRQGTRAYDPDKLGRIIYDLRNSGSGRRLGFYLCDPNGHHGAEDRDAYSTVYFINNARLLKGQHANVQWGIYSQGLSIAPSLVIKVLHPIPIGTELLTMYIPEKYNNMSIHINNKT